MANRRSILVLWKGVAGKHETKRQRKNKQKERRDSWSAETTWDEWVLIFSWDYEEVMATLQNWALSSAQRCPILHVITELSSRSCHLKPCAHVELFGLRKLPKHLKIVTTWCVTCHNNAMGFALSFSSCATASKRIDSIYLTLSFWNRILKIGGRSAASSLNDSGFPIDEVSKQIAPQDIVPCNHLRHRVTPWNILSYF